MANIVKILWSKITGHVPSSLVDGQLAINQKDKKLFYPDENEAICEMSLLPKIFIQETDPALPYPYVWYQVDGVGNLITMWINT
jgi:hypothetical protein